MICSVEGCSDRTYQRGFCQKHYTRWKRHGDPLKTRTAPRGEPLRWLIQHVGHNGDDCLIWPYGKSDNGYGAVFLRGRKEYAHRAMCLLAHGEPIGEQRHAAHACGNGRGGCVNPKHLRWGTPTENMADKIEHGTTNRGERSGNAKLTAGQIVEIKRRLSRGEKQRSVADLFGVTQSNISRIANGGSWSCLQTADKVAKGETDADTARKYLEGLL